jgi:hypothetical protein
MQTPFTLCMPGPHASLTLMTISFDACSGACGMARADDAKTRASIPTVHLIIVSSNPNDNTILLWPL